MKTHRTMYESLRAHRSVLNGDSGQGSVEYLMIIALAVCVACLGAKNFAGAFSKDASSLWQSISQSVSKINPFD